MTSSNAMSDRLIDELTQRIVAQFAPEPVILFGSRARGDANERSDYDLCVVMDTPVRYGYRAAAIKEALRPLAQDVDVVVYTPVEYERRRDDVGTLVYACEVEGRILYEKTPGAPPTRVREESPRRPQSVAWWLERAENDCAAMELATSGGAALDVVCFHAHQCVEKLLKTALILAHVRPPREHDLIKLIDLCPDPLRANAELRGACQVLMTIWPLSCYAEERMPTSAEAAEAAAAARMARNILRPRVTS